jgi:hypothetical protein
LTDGQVPLVAGVRNLNVPGDEDGLANGQIQAVLQFPSTSGGTFARGNGLFRVFDPAGNLTAVTQAFSITQRFYPQGVTGRLTLSGSGLPLAKSVVGLQPLVGTTAGLVTTDTNGSYRFYCLPGIYVVTGGNDGGAIYDQSVFLTVGCGQTVTNNLALTNGTFYLAGRVTDGGSGLGIPALSVDANANNLGVQTSTDTNGNYALQLTTNTWSVHPSTGATLEAGYVDPIRIKVSITSASVSNVNFALSKPTALIYGTVKDTLTNPVVGVQLSARDQPNNFHSVGRSFVTNASYSLGVQAGTWNLAPDSGDLALRGFTGSSSNVTLVSGQTTNINFVVTRTNWPVLQAPVHVSSSVFQFTLNGLAGQNYAIQKTTNLTSGSWVDALATNAPCNTVLIQDTHATNHAGFYRAVVVP